MRSIFVGFSVIASTGLFFGLVNVGSYAQNYPARPIRIIVGVAPGSSTDTLARLIASRLNERWGQSAVVDNRTGAGGNLGAGMVAKSTPDGYTLLMTGGSFSINPSLYSNLTYDAVKDFAPITLVGSAPQLLVTYPGLGVATVRELIALAAAKPGYVSYASAGSGTPSHLGMELLKSMAKIDMVHVPYKGGGPLLNALLSGEVQLYAGNILASTPHLRTGRLRALAVTGPKRSPAVPDIPTVAESGIAGYSVIAWWGLLGPARVPAPIVESLHREISAAFKSPQMSEKLASEGIEIAGVGPAEFSAHIKREIAMWATAVKLTGAHAD